MGLTANDKDRFILEIAGVYTQGADDQLVQDMGKEFTDTLTKQLVSLKVCFPTNNQIYGKDWA